MQKKTLHWCSRHPCNVFNLVVAIRYQAREANNRCIQYSILVMRCQQAQNGFSAGCFCCKSSTPGFRLCVCSSRSFQPFALRPFCLTTLSICRRSYSTGLFACLSGAFLFLCSCILGKYVRSFFRHLVLTLDSPPHNLFQRHALAGFYFWVLVLRYF